MQGPGFTRPAVPGGRSVDLMKLRKPGTGAPMPQMPLMPNQVVFRHKAWLPWWIAVLIPLLLLLALLLFLFLPRNVVVPDVTGTKSAFEAEKKLTKAQLKLAPTPKEKVSTAAAPGTVIGQTPTAGEKAKKDSDVTIEIAVGNGKVQVPNIVGKTQAEADPILEKANLTTGQVQPQPPDPKAKIESQIPAANEVVKEGKPINIFLATIKDKKNGDKAKKKDGGGGGGGGAAKAAAVTLPALGGAVADAAQAAADAGVVPVKVTEFSPKKKGTVIRTEPPAGTKLKAGDKVKIVVSGGFPELTYDDGKNILLANGANGKRFPAVAKGPTEGHRPDLLGRRDADRLRRQSTGLPQGPLEEGLHRGAAHRPWRQVQRPRMGADGQRQPDRDAPRQEPEGRQLGPGPLPAAGEQEPAGAAVQVGAGLQRGEDRQVGSSTASRSSRSGSSPTRPASPRRSASSAGRRRSRSPPTSTTGARAASRATSRTRPRA